jgi:hypothetical protein
MSGVVLRCPSCGTTRAAPGECEACHEAQVRYYCSNHTPGRWLDAPSCPQCGARFGEPARAPVRPAPAAPTRAPARPAPAAPGRTPAPAPSAAPRPSPASAGRPVAGARPSARPERLPPVEDEAIDLRDERVARGAGWDDLLRAAARVRRTPSETVFGREAEPPAAGRRPGGCLLRFILIVVFLFLALMGGLSVLGGSLLRLFLPY